MFKLLRNIFKRKKIKEFSTTLTSTKEGEDNLTDLNPEIRKIVNKAMSNEKMISNEELNKLINFFFSELNEVKPGLYKLNSTFRKDMVFEIKGVNIVSESNGRLSDIVLVIKEIAYNMDLLIFVSIKNFHEVFEYFNFEPPKSSKKEKNTV